ncbi:MAG: SpoIIE family protein phosphatase, partial [Spirochaetia bacterium]|nr:SpoIIE family protein phosphatase [Spirochaetia bacterium]
PTHPVWNTRFSFLSANASLIMSLLFTRRFLNLSIIAQPLNRAMIALVTVAGAAAVASQILDHRGADIVSRSVGALVAVTVSIAALLAWVRGYAPARFFFAAWFLFILAALLFTLMGLGFLPRNDFTRYSMQIGSAVEMVLLSLALSDRITILRRQRDSAEAVARSMEREMETARSIQNAILPGSLPATPRATFAARYKPAASVGGDFYDFHQISKDKIGILIADVTGHGVPAALVASMLKVSFAHQR